MLRSILSPRQLSALEKPKQSFRFLDLPPELRNRVYTYAFTIQTEDGEVDLANRSTIGKRGGSHLHILQTCRQIHEEAQCIFYAINNLSIDSAALGKLEPERWSDRGFLYSTSEARLRAITNFTVRIYGGRLGIQNTLHVLRCLVGLKTLHLRLDTVYAGGIVKRGSLQKDFRTVVESAPALETITLSGFGTARSATRARAQALLQGFIDAVRAGRDAEEQEVEE